MVAEARPVMAASRMPRKSDGKRASSMRMTRKLSLVGAPIAQIRSLRVQSFSEVSANGVDRKYLIAKASCMRLIWEIVPWH